MRTSPRPGYSTREVARLIDLPEGRIRAFVRAGFLSPRRGPGRRHLFSFQDLVLLRAARALTEAEIPPQRVRRALVRLAQQLPKGRSLSAVRITAEGSQVVVREEGAAWEPESGQRILDFEVAELAELAEPLALEQAREAQNRAGELGAEDWFELALELEATAPGEARAAYGRVLESDPDHPDALLNLGRILHESGELAAAEAHYRKVYDLDPWDATAAFNLGVVLQDQGRREAAEAAYRAALARDPGYADAHFNLSLLYEASGRPRKALRSLQAYRRLTQR